MTLPAIPQTAGNIRALVMQLLDRGYDQATAQVLRAIDRNSTSGIVAQRLKELQQEAARLADAGEKLSPDNAVLRALTADLETAQARNAALVDAAASDVQAVGVDAAGRVTRGLAFPGLSDAQLRGVGIKWNNPSAEAVNKLVGYTNSDAFATALHDLSPRIMEAVQNVSLQGFVTGQGPLATAREIQRVIEGMPLYEANTMLRTLQLQSYRSGALVHQVSNADVIDYVLRVETMDDRVCMSCVFLNGTRMEVDEPIEEHENPIYGPMIREASLKGMIGSAAKEYYAR